MRTGNAVDEAWAAFARAERLAAASKAARLRAREVVARSKTLRRPACSTPRCIQPAASRAELVVRCTAGVRREAMWIPLPITMCRAHRGLPSLAAFMRSSSPWFLTDVLASARLRWSKWSRARVLYFDLARDATVSSLAASSAPRVRPKRDRVRGTARPETA